MTIQETKDQVIQEFSQFTDWEDKYRHLIQMGKALPVFPSGFQTDDYKVNGCQSQVWLKADLDGNRVVFLADSDAFIVKGLVALLLRIYSGQTPADILAFPPDFLKEIGLDQHLSQNRTNGLAAMVKKIKTYAIGYQMVLQRSGKG
ncbi:MAG: SufE family protein [Bacteroidetes bacterium]|nr:SufE family protein [Bacteroidota bacterium]